MKIPDTQANLRRTMVVVALILIVTCGARAPRIAAQIAPEGDKQKIIPDTDIGDDIDDAFALALAETSPKASPRVREAHTPDRRQTIAGWDVGREHESRHRGNLHDRLI
jgi:hypothetical protein